MPNEIDRLMSLDPLELSAQDIDSIIDYQRKARQSYLAGGKPRKASESAPAISLADIGLKKPEPAIKRRKL